MADSTKILSGVERHPAADNPVLTAADVTDVENCSFVADPFVFRVDGRYYMFFEAGASPNVLAYAESSDGIDWTYGGVVLEADTQLSFPQVFRNDGSWFMIPSLSPGTEAVRLYEAVDFPTVWERSETLLSGRPLVDPLLVSRGEYFWLLCADTSFDWFSRDAVDRLCRRPPSYSLRVYYARELTGDWNPVDGNPVLKDRRAQRPAGPAVTTDDELFTFFQEWQRDGPVAVQSYRVTELSQSGYTHTETAASRVVAAGQDGEWTQKAMHHLDTSLSESDGLVVADGKGPDGNWRIGVFRPT